MSRAARITKFVKAAKACKGTKGKGAFRACMRKKLKK